MEPERRALLESHMQHLADGDPAFVFTLLNDFAPEIRGMVRGFVGGMGRRDILADDDEVNGLMQDVAFILMDVARTWQPGSALPWVYAERAIKTSIGVAVGHAVGGSEEDLEAEVSDADISGTVDLGVEYLEAMAETDPRIELVLEAVHSAASPRNAAVFLEYQLGKLLECRGASQTVGTLVELSPANVRQIRCRVRKKLDTVLEDPRYATIIDLPLLVA